MIQNRIEQQLQRGFSPSKAPTRVHLILPFERGRSRAGVSGSTKVAHLADPALMQVNRCGSRPCKRGHSEGAARRIAGSAAAAAVPSGQSGALFLTSPTGLADPAVGNSHRGAGSKRNHRGRMVSPALSEPLAAFAPAAAPRVVF